MDPNPHMPPAGDHVKHEPLVSDTLKEGAAHAREQAERIEADSPHPQDGSLKQHGDALKRGSGTRHGVDAAAETRAT